ncbi:acyltransferase family protein [Caballeronia sordidicola]|uniref:acyltransferase family protein n=1 Tax=Caballeronia sordidicola TaxID=196367 RepID=UPI0004CFF18C|nr:acyltransferase [Caballeronia sordidicola]
MFEKNKIYSVHFLRFFAAAAVVVHHVLQRYTGKVTVGAAGVDVFFVISGFVIGLALQGNDTSTRFAVKRLIRVMPLYWTATLVYGYFRFVAWGLTPAPSEILRSIFLWPPFGHPWYPIYYPAWTLEFEMLFYGIATVCLIFFRKNACNACLILVLCVSPILIQVPGSVRGTFPETQFLLEFAAGIVVAQTIDILRARLKPAIGLWLVLGALAIFAINYTQTSARPIAWGVPSAMMVVGMIAFERTAWLKNRFIVLGGDASYAIYLTHITAIEFLGEAGKWWHIPFEKHLIIAFPLLIGAGIGCGIVAHLLIEKPMLIVLRGFLLPKRTVIA